MRSFLEVDTNNPKTNFWTWENTLAFQLNKTQFCPSNHSDDSKVIKETQTKTNDDYFLLSAFLLSRALKTSHMRACASITCDEWAMSLCHEPPNDPFEKAQKEPHGSLEVKCGSSEHDIYRVSEKTLVEVPSQTMVALASTTVFPLFLSSPPSSCPPWQDWCGCFPWG